MRTLTTILAALTMTLVLAAPAAAANEPQTGTLTTCAEYNALYIAGVTTGMSVVAVEPGTAYTITSDAGSAFVDFFDANGKWVGYSGNSPLVPAEAAFGVVCVGALALWPVAPLPSATWTYQDGF